MSPITTPIIDHVICFLAFSCAVSSPAEKKYIIPLTRKLIIAKNPKIAKSQFVKFAITLVRFPLGNPTFVGSATPCAFAKYAKQNIAINPKNKLMKIFFRLPEML